MELYKDKEEADAITRDNDLSQGIKLDIDPNTIDFSQFDEKSNKAVLHKEITEEIIQKKNNNTLDELHSFKHPMGDTQDTSTIYGGIPLDDIPEEVIETILSIEDIIANLDEGEDTIDG